MEKKSTVITTVSLTKENYDFLKKEARADNRSMGSYVNMLISKQRAK